VSGVHEEITRKNASNRLPGVIGSESEVRKRKSSGRQIEQAILALRQRCPNGCDMVVSVMIRIT
jgi:hypothetical protein